MSRPFGLEQFVSESTLRLARDHPRTKDAWFWCRAHGEAEHISNPPWSMCIRIGPFMSEREANILRRPIVVDHMAQEWPLGMKVEP